MKNYNGSILRLQERKDIQAQIFPLFSVGSLCGDEKWLLFSVDRVNVTIFWETSLWTVDEVTQFLPNPKNIKETVGKNKLIRSKLLEELNSLFF